MTNTVSLDNDYPVIHASDDLFNRATGLIPAHSQTLAKGPTQYVNGVAPKYLVRGQGSRVWDADGNEYIDLVMGVGPVSLGYAWKPVDDAIRRQLADGISFSLVHPLEVQLAERLRRFIPNAEAVRYSKTGADVTSAAVRLARAYTGRDKVLCCGYHGWHDWYIGVTPRSAGVPEAVQALVHTFDYNDMTSVLAGLDNDTACVILEPLAFEMPRSGFLHELAAACHKAGALLIFDEMWTGFRLALGGAQELFEVTPDLACYSKAIANGMPLAVLTGRADVMRMLDDEVFFFTTFGGETLSLAAAMATLDEMERYQLPAHLAFQGQKLKAGYNRIAADLGLDSLTRCIGHPSRTMVVWEDHAGDPLLLKSLVQQELIRCGVLWSGFHNLCLAHSDEDIEYVLAAYSKALPLLKTAIERDSVAEALRGVPVQPVFRKTGNFNTRPAPAAVQVNGQVTPAKM
ncbi:MAG: aminotransferase class III-fold pyridoxal phosphate-dependent enzyme [Caldilineae bacterium]|nr:aminotransferase class III-fold pyridoxal phosphate-dependent enzyme [Caldilineae bacterium]